MNILKNATSQQLGAIGDISAFLGKGPTGFSNNLVVWEDYFSGMNNDSNHLVVIHLNTKENRLMYTYNLDYMPYMTLNGIAAHYNINMIEVEPSV